MIKKQIAENSESLQHYKVHRQHERNHAGTCLSLCMCPYRLSGANVRSTKGEYIR